MSKKIDWDGIEADFASTDLPVLQIATKHGVSEGAIRARSKKLGWVRNSLPLKRALVSQRLTGITSGNTKNEIRKALENEADESADDMRLGLSVARKVLGRLETMAELCDTPRDVKVVAEANKIAIETIRRIRGLDEQAAPEIVIERSYGKANE